MAKGNKTHKATAKRFKITASGKVVHKKQMDNAHLKANKSSKTKNRQKKGGMIGSKTQAKKIKQLM